MADTLYEIGAQYLFQSGWINRAQRMRLFTATGTLVDEKLCSFSFVLGKLSLDANVEFDVLTPTNDITYIALIYYVDSPTEQRFQMYRKDLTQVYDFLTSGKLIIDALDFSISATPLTAFGEETLFTSGWEGISTVRLRTGTGTTVASGSITFDTTVNGDLVMQGGTNTLVIPASSNNVAVIQLLDGLSKIIWDKTLSAPAPYNIAVESDFRILSWGFSI